MRLTALLAAATLLAQTPPEQRLNQHRVSSTRSPSQQPGAENQLIPSLVEGLNKPGDWKKRRKQIQARWVNMLGKIAPKGPDKRWFGDIRKAHIYDTAEKEKYTRIHLDLPMEKDFSQPHLLLIPKGQGNGPFPAVICYSSSSPDYMEPENWWGAWLAERGYVVLTGWSFIRNYRDKTTARNGAAEKVYDRFGHWLALGKMVHDVKREIDYLKSVKQVDKKRIGLIGFSLGAKVAVYAGAFLPELKATVALDPHIAVNGGTNWYAPWYLDWMRPWPDIATSEHTPLSVLDSDPARPGFEHDHHELLALAAPRAFLIIGGAGNKEDNGGDSDDRQSWGYVNRAKEVYKLLGAEDRLQFTLTSDGHHANGPAIDPAWQQFFEKHLKH
ncbi:MAG: dienelactone hydrolase family protein [Bryobacteraceae bacterium]